LPFQNTDEIQKEPIEVFKSMTSEESIFTRPCSINEIGDAVEQNINKALQTFDSFSYTPDSIKDIVHITDGTYHRWYISPT